ncbi:MAG: hypothetical protein KDA05_12480, partial [Phycisphaerales bacterium]|nr:hypothetical protein [Phycisphaerales bacterium]
LLVVIAIISLLIAILLPSLGAARRAAQAAACLSNVRQLEIAHTMYADDYEGAFIDAGLDHGGIGDASNAWPVILARQYGAGISLRSPGDDSPAWSIRQGGQDPGLTLDEALALLHDDNPANNPPQSDLARWTSYGLNNYTTRSKSPDPLFLPTPTTRYDSIERTPSPAATIHFLQMTEGHPRPPQNSISAFAKSDHVHVEDWASAGPGNEAGVASGEMELAAWGGRFGTPEGRANYGFLDGHAETRRFKEVYRAFNENNFDPASAQ